MHPRAISIVISKRLKEAYNNRATPDATGISEDIKTSIESLKIFSIHKRASKALCIPLYPSAEVFELTSEEPASDAIKAELGRMIDKLTSSKEQVDSLYSEIQQRIEAEWPSKKQLLVPGSNVLEAVFRQYGLKYHKDTDGPKIAAEMLSDEISQQIKTLLSQIVKT